MRRNSKPGGAAWHEVSVAWRTEHQQCVNSVGHLTPQARLKDKKKQNSHRVSITNTKYKKNNMHININIRIYI